MPDKLDALAKQIEELRMQVSLLVAAHNTKNRSGQSITTTAGDINEAGLIVENPASHLVNDATAGFVEPTVPLKVPVTYLFSSLIFTLSSAVATGQAAQILRENWSMQNLLSFQTAALYSLGYLVYTWECVQDSKSDTCSQQQQAGPSSSIKWPGYPAAAVRTALEWLGCTLWGSVCAAAVAAAVAAAGRLKPVLSLHVLWGLLLLHSSAGSDLAAFGVAVLATAAYCCCCLYASGK